METKVIIAMSNQIFDVAFIDQNLSPSIVKETFCLTSFLLKNTTPPQQPDHSSRGRRCFRKIQHLHVLLLLLLFFFILGGSSKNNQLISSVSCMTLRAGITERRKLELQTLVKEIKEVLSCS